MTTLLVLAALTFGFVAGAEWAEKQKMPPWLALVGFLASSLVSLLY